MTMIPTSDTFLAQNLADARRDNLAWTAGSGWFHYPENGTHWIRIPEELVLKNVNADLHAQYRIGSAATTDADVARKLSVLLTTGKAKSVLALLSGHLHRLDSDFDAHPDLLNAQNGVVDLKTGELLPHDPQLLFTKVTKVAYKRNHKHLLWEKALEAVPKDVQPWLQQRLGQSAIGRIAPKGLLIIFLGGGSNGKTTILGGCSDALGDYGILIPDKVLLGNVSDHSTELTELKGARFAMIEETAQSKKLDVTRMKKLIDTPQMTARRVRQDSMTWDSTHTIFLSSNFRPIVTETDHGTWRRLALVDFPFTFTESDFRDQTKAPEVLEAVLAWLVDGAVSISSSALEIPATVKEATLKWREETDLVLAFIRARIELNSTSKVLASDMLDEFNAYIGTSRQVAWAGRGFVPQMESHDALSGKGVKHGRTRDLKGLVRPLSKTGEPVPDQPYVWSGVKLKDKSDEEIHAATHNWSHLISIATEPGGHDD